MRKNILCYLEDTVRRLPGKLAFSDGTDGMSFSEVSNAAKRVGSSLLRIFPNAQPVAVLMKKHPREIACFFGVVYAGGFYIPMDLEMPAARINLILESTGANTLIVDDAGEKCVEALDFSGRVLRYDELLNGEIDEDALQTVREKQIDTDPIYIVFTSGSTGIPKGVAACHRSVIDYTEALCEALPFSEDTVFGNQTPLFFDAPLKELMPTIKYGATTYLIPKKNFLFPTKLCDFLNENRINTVCWVVSALTMISSLGVLEKNPPKYLTTVAFGSEVFPPVQYQKWRKALPHAKFFNLYGPTEATGMSCYWAAERELSEKESIPIGKPFQNTDLFLLDEQGNLAKKGETGEIYLRGTCVTLGYYNNPEKTGEAFVQNPLQHHYPELVYKTGDNGYFNAYGELVFVGRRDAQIKHMGHRIELGEIEAAVSSVPTVHRACCLYDAENKQIFLFFTGLANADEISLVLKEKLPRYMLPGVYRKLDRMPLTPNGKLDRKLLSGMMREGNEYE